jgi:hypothetical protein
MRSLSFVAFVAVAFWSCSVSSYAAAPNVALGRPTSQSSQNGSFSPDLAVNGNLGDFSHTAAGQNLPSTWEVNLTNTYAIEKIILYNRTSCCQSRMRDITVRIVDVAGAVTNWTSVLLNPENAGFVFSAGPANLTLDLVALTGGTINGGRVRITRTPDPDLSGSGGQGNTDEADVLALGEVEVFGTAAQPNFVPLNSTWKYLANGTDPGALWFGTNFNDTAWSSGAAELGYGDGDETTTVSFGPDASNKYVTTYFRKSFVATNAAAFSNLLLRLTYDDGAIVYLNETEVRRVNMPGGPVTATTLALSDAEFAVDATLLPTSALINGTNFIAVEVHQGATNTPDLSFALELSGVIPPVVALTSPTNTPIIYGPIAVALTANATDADGSIVGVQFFEGTNSLGSDTTAPFNANTATLFEGNYVFRAVATDSSGIAVTSAPVNITLVDTNPPAILSVFATTNSLKVTFSKTVTNVGSYVINNGVSVLNHAFDPASSRAVILTTSPMEFGSNYVLTANGVNDLGGRSIAANTMVTFNLLNFTATDVGSPSLAGSSIITGLSGFNVTGAGSDIGGSADQFQFESRLYTGDFDVKVRLESLSFADAWSKAGLMARESLAAGSRFAGAFATPTISGCFFQYRDSVGALSVPSGAFPNTYPNLWLRLRRVGSAFTGFAGVDGNAWSQLGTVTNLNLPATLSVGMAVTSRATNQPVTAQFREFTDVVGNPSSVTISLPREPLGPSSRRTPLVFTEINYQPREIPGYTNNAEFIELFNSGSIDENLGGCRISGAVNFTFPPNTILRAGAFLVVAREPDFIRTYYNITNVAGPYTNTLPNDAGTVRLRSRTDAVLLEVAYQGANPWPIGADGTGHSLVLSRPSYGENNAAAWSPSENLDGSPGAAEPFVFEPLRAVVINEFLAHSAPPQEDYIELYNHSNVALDLSGAWLSDEAETNKFRIPDGTTIPARGFVAFIESQLGFALSSGGERIFLVNSNKARVIDAIEFDNQALGVSSGRYPDGASSFYLMAARTPGATNSGPRRSDIVINEIMFSPITGGDDDEFVELYNRGTNPVNLARWKLSDGISFAFPAGASVAPGGYVVVAKNVTNLLAHYPGVLTTANTFGDYGGTLANGGERIALSRPEEILATNGVNIVTTRLDIVVNEVTYADGGRWGNWADGGGSSLELIHPDADTRLSANWADSDERAKSVWSNIEYTWNMGEPLGTPTNDNVQVFLLGVGECLVDDIEVRSSSSPAINSVGANFGFESGLAGWTLQGSHDQSTIENVGYSGSQSLHLRAASRGDNGANRIRSPVLNPIPINAVTLRCKARWLRGWPELALRLHGGTLEAAGRFNVPLNLGTPGAANSRARPNAGPAIFEVQHSPVLPAPGDAVVVTARANDPDGVAALTLFYRIDPTPTFTSANMLDDGTGADAIAGDGIFSATLPAQASGQIAAFYIQGTDALGATNLFPRDVFPTDSAGVFPNDSSSRECLVRWGEVQMLGNFPTYHLWLTSNSLSRWTTRDSLNNAPIDGTFVFNNYRVVYNAGALFSGSPFHRGNMTTGPAGSSRCDYIVQMPADDKVMGSGDFNLTLPGNSNGTTTSHDLAAQAEQTSYIFFQELGLPYYLRRYVHVFVNGTQRNTVSSLSGSFIYEDAQQPNGEVIEELYPDDANGELIKIEDWFEFNDAATAFSNNDGDLTRRLVSYNGTNALNFAPYRFMWRKRSLGAGDSANDYTNFFKLLDALSPTTVNNAPLDLPRFSAAADWEQWMREIACQHTVGNFDSYGFDRGKNNYLYLPRNGRALLLPWDIDWTMGTGSGRGPTEPLFNSNDPRMVAAFATPDIRRAYLRAYKNLVDGPLNNSFIDPIMDAKAAAFTQNNVNFSPATVGTIKGYVLSRRNYILSQLVGLTNAFTMSSTPSYTTSNQVVTITGYAPVDAKDIAVNGVIYPVTWAANFTTWTVRVALTNATNVLIVQGLDLKGQQVAGARATNTVNYAGAPLEPITSVVINEIMFQPTVAGTEYLELFNNSTNTTFDLAGWRVNGIDYAFPGGSLIGPRSYLVLVKDRLAFTSTYGTNIVVFDQFDGGLRSNGETISLIKPGGAPDGSDLIVDRVRYDGVLPWPVVPGITGFSFQLTDPAQDNSRVGNWSSSFSPTRTNDGWRFFSASGNIGSGDGGGSMRLLIYLDSPGSTVLDDIAVVGGTNAAVGSNYVTNGDFELPLDSSPTNGWKIGTNAYGNSLIVTDLVHTGTGAFKIIGTNSAGAANPPSYNKSIYQFLSPAPAVSSINTLSFWYWATNSATNLLVRIRNSGPLTTGALGTNIQPTISPATNFITPGTNNFVVAALPPFPTLWINEVQPENVGGILDSAGQREPWVEIYNSGTNAVSLDGLYLSTNYASLTSWAFPAGHMISPGEFMVVFCDAQPGQTTNNELHTSFRLPAISGSVALSRLHEGQPQVVDYVNYAGLHSDRSYGSFPDGQPFDRQEFFYVTPGGTNNGTAAPLIVFINEWMAGNAAALADPADGNFEDWFELYNPATNAVDIAGYYLTDSLANGAGVVTNKFKYLITTNGPHVIPPQGHLLVWADNETGQNLAAGVPRPDLHVNFALSLGGEAIGLFAADGTQIDRVTFAQQTNDVSMGRYPDGNAAIYFMPTTVSPRAANYLPASSNTPPVLGAIGNKIIYFGQTLAFTATATDSDLPAQALIFSLDPTPPSGASISGAGAFTWTPASVGTSAITIRVTDNGVPAKNDFESITVEVLAAPGFTSSVRNGDNFELTWRTRAGRSYAVDYKDDLNAANWTPLWTNTALGDSLSFTNATTNGPQRFFRMRTVD